MTPGEVTSELMQDVVRLAERVAEVGREIGLPYIGTSPDIGSPAPMFGPDGRPFNGDLFRWLDPDLRYWEDRGFALRSAFVYATRSCAEPFYFKHGKLASWRVNPTLDAINATYPIDPMGVGTAIVAPAYLPAGVIGAVVWASPDEDVPVDRVFAERAVELHALTLKLMGAYADARLGAGPAEAPVRLTRREIQCLRWAAAGKTDHEVADIVGISMPTVRFHITNASRKLHVVGRSQAIHRAATLGYIGATPPAARVSA
ncbi:LuxR family transcriptional regulator [Phenylobacterium soli]|uniref:LuxR family transcriptional regulator n=2 Tax=Phenylobacterium soli TaxID=2170551 RepID=A0A328AN29_9CAUL|nr:LuxR family transcriptional regulator [Phenylobacterium soli]